MLPQSTVLETFKEQHFKGFKMPIFAVYDNPLDFPGRFVVRLFNLQEPTVYCTLSSTKEEAFATIPKGLTFLPRQNGDEPQLVGTFF